MKKIIIIVIILNFAFTNDSCKKDMNPISSTAKLYSTLIIGSWAWLYSIIQWPQYRIVTPDSVGYTEKRCFNDEDLLSILRNDTLFATCEYEVVYVNSNEIKSSGQL